MIKRANSLLATVRLPCPLGETRLSTVSDSVEILVDVLRNGLNLGVQFILNLEHVILVVLCDQVDGQTKVTEPSRPTDSVQVGVTVAREVKVDDHIDCHDIDTTGEQVCADQTTCLSSLEVMENSTHRQRQMRIQFRDQKC